jgi:serine/threonine-protein kinase
VIVGSLLIGGLLSAVAISNITRQQQPETTIATNPTPSPESLPTPASAEPSASSETSPVPVIPTSPPRRRVIPDVPTFNPPVVSTPQPEKEPVTSDTPAPEVRSTPQPEPENIAPSTPQNNDQPPSKVATTNSSQSVPAFPTGTPRSAVEATLGKPNQDLRGVWGNTRAVVYKLVPNKIDLGYLFDRNSKVLRQTEVSFAQSVDSQVMEATLNGLLNGQATEEIKQGLKQVQQRQSDNFRFKKGSVKGQIIRQECNFIYISIWDENLHDFVSPSTAKRC